MTKFPKLLCYNPIYRGGGTLYHKRLLSGITFFSTTSTYTILCDFYQILSSHVSGNFGVLTIIISSDIGHYSKQPSKLRSNLHKMHLAITWTKTIVMTWNLEHMLLVSMWFEKYSFNPILTKFPRFYPFFPDFFPILIFWA